MKITFIGCGNMAVAMISGILSKGLVSPEDITASAKTQATLDSIKTRMGINTTLDNVKAIHGADFIVLSVKPKLYETVIRQIRAELLEGQTIIAIAAGKTLSWMKSALGDYSSGINIVRAMPNTPAMVGAGMSAICADEGMDEDRLRQVLSIFDSFGRSRMVEEEFFDAVTAISGSSPAYVCIFIEAMADAAVAEGMPRDMAQEFAAYAVMGSAKMIFESRESPAVLKDRVCSPKGTTIEAVKSLERSAFRAAVIDAVEECVSKSKRMTD